MGVILKSPEYFSTIFYGDVSHAAAFFEELENQGVVISSFFCPHMHASRPHVHIMYKTSDNSFVLRHLREVGFLGSSLGLQVNPVDWGLFCGNLKKGD